MQRQKRTGEAVFSCKRTSLSVKFFKRREGIYEPSTMYVYTDGGMGAAEKVISLRTRRQGFLTICTFEIGLH